MRAPEWTPKRSGRGAGRSLQEPNEDLPKAGCELGTVTLGILAEIAWLSWSQYGLRLAKELLFKRGISLVIEKHLPKASHDGAALGLRDGRPVIGLTLRYDSTDISWFCQLHELASVGRLMDRDKGKVFVDDFTLRELEGRREDSWETEADKRAEEALVPRSVWEASAAHDRPTAMAVMNLARHL